MPDLTTHATWWCSSNLHRKWLYKSRSQENHWHLVHWRRLPPDAPTEYGYTCSCWPFKKKGVCDHIEKAKADHCRWNWEMEVGAEALEIPCRECGHPKRVCPQCEGSVEAINVAV